MQNSQHYQNGQYDFYPCLPDVARAVVPEHPVQEIVGEGGVFASADQEESLLVRHSGRLLHESEG